MNFSFMPYRLSTSKLSESFIYMHIFASFLFLSTFYLKCKEGVGVDPGGFVPAFSGGLTCPAGLRLCLSVCTCKLLTGHVCSCSFLGGLARSTRTSRPSRCPEGRAGEKVKETRSVTPRAGPGPASGRDRVLHGCHSF